jgi:hypothetical protein
MEPEMVGAADPALPFLIWPDSPVNIDSARLGEKG